MIHGRYILVGKEPKLCNSLLEWARWFEKADRKVALTEMGKVSVSTVFLGLDHNFGSAKNPPILFETMVFGGKYDQRCSRSRTWQEAEQTHQEWVKKVKSA